MANAISPHNIPSISSTVGPPSVRTAWRRWLLHPVTQNLGIWLLAAMPYLLIGLSTNAGWANIGQSLLRTFLPACLYFALPIYTHAFFIAPLFQRQKYGLFLLLFILNVLFWSGIVFIPERQYVPMRGLNLPVHFVMVGVITFLAALIRIARDAVVRNQESRQAELQLLKDQLNPHFLFNTLNNLYGLAVVKSDKLPRLMLQLSDLLRYSLYQTNEPYVSLENELDYLRNYIALESVRLIDRADIDLRIEGDDPSGYRIAPLLLISLIENCFKHQGSAPGSRGFVDIILRVADHRLHLQTANSCWPLLTEHSNRPSGIGLTNVRQRLRLLYPGKYSLDTQQREDRFDVTLKIDLL